MKAREEKAPSRIGFEPSNRGSPLLAIESRALHCATELFPQLIKIVKYFNAASHNALIMRLKFCVVLNRSNVYSTKESRATLNQFVSLWQHKDIFVRLFARAV